MPRPETPPLNRVKRLHTAGQPSFGLLATIPSIQVVQILARAGLDWIIIDMEHGPIDLTAAHAMITATAGTGMARSSASAGTAPGSPSRPWTWAPWGSRSR